MKKICIVPARGGSKRLPRKNILKFRGKSLLEHAVKTAQDASIFDFVIVSSEDAEILDIASSVGAEIHKRPGSIATDTSTVSEVCLDIISTHDCDVFCCLYPTAVLLTAETLVKSETVFLGQTQDETSTLMGVSRYNYHPLKALIRDDSGYWKTIPNPYGQIRSQCYPEAFVSNGTFYWAHKSYFLDHPSFYGPKLKVYEVEPSQVLDIDTKDDYAKLLRNF